MFSGHLQAAFNEARQHWTYSFFPRHAGNYSDYNTENITKNQASNISAKFLETQVKQKLKQTRDWK